MENNFGEFLRNLRLSYKLTRKELCANICSEKQLERIEKNVNIPSIYILHCLSEKLNVDLNKFYKDFFSQSMEDRENSKKIIEYIKILDFYNLNILCNKLKLKDNFKKGNLYAHLCYGEAAYEFYINKNYIKSIKLCNQGILEETPYFKIDEITNNIFSNIGYCMLNLIASCYKKENNFIMSDNIIQSILMSIENFYIKKSNVSYSSDSFINKIYQTMLCQKANNSYNIGNYKEALEYINNCLSFSFNNDMSRLLASLFQLKYLTLYKLNDYHASRECYIAAKTLYLNSNKYKIATDMEEKAKKDFPLIFIDS